MRKLTTNGTGSKTCSRCQKERSLHDFYVDRRRPDGRHSRCKKCVYETNLAKRQRLEAAAKEKRAKIKAYAAAYYKRNQDELKARSLKNYTANPEWNRFQRREYARTHKQEAKVRNNRWRRDHLARSSEYKRSRLEADPEKRALQNAANRKWAHANRSTTRIHCLKRAAKERLAHAGRYTAAQWQRLLHKCGHKCLCCRKHESETPEGQLQADHVVPVSQLDHVPFGPLTKEMAELNLIGNIQPLCKTCNLKKGTKMGLGFDYRKRGSKRHR